MVWKFTTAALALALFTSANAATAPATETQHSSADLSTYATEDGQSYFALSLMPPADAAPQPQARDIVILFDTSASQIGAFRDSALSALEACLAKLNPKDRVQLFAADLEARPMTKGFVAAGSAELKTAVQALRNESPLGSTDVENVLRTAASKFEKGQSDNRVLFYIGDGMSSANLLGTDSFRSLVGDLAKAHIPVSSYAIGPQIDGRLLASLANQTGGNLYIAEPMTKANDAEKITADRATEENIRRSANVGEDMANWAQATVFWPTSCTWPTELGQVYPKALTPLRSDRDSIAIGTPPAALTKPVEISAQFTAEGKPVELHWSATPKNGGATYAYLPQVVRSAKADDGITLPTVGSAALAEAGRVAEAGIDGLTDLAERSVVTGDVLGAQVAAQAVLARDPGNVKAKTVQRVIDKKRTDAKLVAQGAATAPAAPAALPPQGPAISPAAAAPATGNDLSLVRQPAALPPQSPGQPQNLPSPATAPSVPGSLTDQFAPSGALVDEVQQQRRVFGQMLRRQVENTVIDARKTMSDDPETAMQSLKLALDNVQRAPELTPDVRAQLVDKLQASLREAQHAAVVKDELEASREEELAAARERRMLNDRMARDREKEKQLVDRFNALVDERRYDEALDVAGTLDEVDPTGVTPVVATISSELRRNDYLMQLTRAARWTNTFDTLYQVEKSSVPFPDDPPIVYPAAPVWEELSNRRKDRYGSMDLKATGEAEQKIEKALRSPLHTNGLDFVETPLKEVVEQMATDYGIPVQLDKTALDEVGVNEDQPVNVNLHNVSLRSALRLMLKSLQLTYIIQDEVLMITTPDAAQKNLVVKVYPVADLVLPIDSSLLNNSSGGGGGGGIGGQSGGGGGGGFGGGGGGGGLGGGGGGGLGGGGGGGLFSVPDDAQKAPASLPAKVAPEQTKSAAPSASAPASSNAVVAPKQAKASAIAMDSSKNPTEFWGTYFAQHHPDPASIRETARQLVAKKQFDQVIAMINAALRNGQPQPWMYESLGIAMELNGSSKSDIERAVMSAVDFSNSADEMMYVAQYLSRLGLDRRAMLVCEQVAKMEPLRGEAYVLGLRSAQNVDDVAGIRWATIGILGQAWPTRMAEIELTASRVAKATLERLGSEGRTDERDAFLNELQQAVVRDCVVRVSWTGEADVDISVEEPSGTVCSEAEPRTIGGGVRLGDGYTAKDKADEGANEVYVCPKGFAGSYRVQIHKVWGEVAAGKVTVDVYTHLRSGDVQHERQQLELSDKDAMVVFDLNHGRRTDPVETAQLAGAIDRQDKISRAVLAQQLDTGSDPSVAPNPNRFFPGADPRRPFFGGRNAVGFQPIIQTLPEGTMFSTVGVVSSDRRYVRVAVEPVFSTIGDVQTFTFAGAAQSQNGTGTGTGTTGL
ncbi:MAG TPA: hypothetical protein VH107_09595 [Lacipirellulaceae bacterium]|jgi:hypothetical protein|nr:hypothetical protein [Lacipirellulaceae bacterium]